MVAVIGNDDAQVIPSWGPSRRGGGCRWPGWRISLARWIDYRLAEQALKRESHLYQARAGRLKMRAGTGRWLSGVEELLTRESAGWAGSEEARGAPR
jgi:hypothetical protein